MLPASTHNFSYLHRIHSTTSLYSLANTHNFSCLHWIHSTTSVCKHSQLLLLALDSLHSIRLRTDKHSQLLLLPLDSLHHIRLLTRKHSQHLLLALDSLHHIRRLAADASCVRLLALCVLLASTHNCPCFCLVHFTTLLHSLPTASLHHPPCLHVPAIDPLSILTITHTPLCHPPHHFIPLHFTQQHRLASWIHSPTSPALPLSPPAAI